MRAFLLREYARMVSHVKLRETHTKGMEGLIQEHGFDLVQISHHVHKPDICTPIEGKVYSITGNTPGWPKLPRHTPFHVGCRHVETPFVDTFLSDEKIAELQALSNQAAPVHTYTPEQLAQADAKRAQRERGRKLRKARERKNAAAVASGKKKPVQAVKEEILAARADDQPVSVSDNWKAPMLQVPVESPDPEREMAAAGAGGRRSGRGGGSGRGGRDSGGSQSGRGGGGRQGGGTGIPPFRDEDRPAIPLVPSPVGQAMLLGTKELPTDIGRPLRIDAGDITHIVIHEPLKVEERFQRAAWIAEAVTNPLVPGRQMYHGRPKRVWYTAIRPSENEPAQHFVVFAHDTTGGLKLDSWMVTDDEVWIAKLLGELE